MSASEKDLCINCAFLVCASGDEPLTPAASSARDRFLSGTAPFRALPEAFACEKRIWSPDEFDGYVYHGLVAVEVGIDYATKSTHASICSTDRKPLGCFWAFDPAVPAELAVRRAEDASHRRAELAISTEQAALDRRLLKITVAALILSSIFSLASLIVSIVALRSPVRINTPIEVRLQSPPNRGSVVPHVSRVQRRSGP